MEFAKDVWDKIKVKSLTSVNFIDHVTLSNSKCTEMEIEWLKCADRVGLMHSREKCPELFEDYAECTYMTKSKQRMVALRRQAFREKLNPANIFNKED